MAWIPAAASMVGSIAGASKGSPAGPSQSDQMVSNGIDFSNWTVSTGKSKATAENADSAVVPDWLKLAALALAAVVAVRWITKK